jgi:anti-sigma28 factor (negative regulator of flagellin synthesis)
MHDNQPLDVDSDQLHLLQSIQPGQVDRRSSVNHSIEKLSAVDQLMVKRGVEASHRWPKSRLERVARLRELAMSGTYQANSRSLAESMLLNETHFSNVETQ